MTTIFTGARFQAINLGVVPGARLYTYGAGGPASPSNFQPSYTSTGAANTNPVICNAFGQADVRLDQTLSYRVVVTDASGVTIYDEDNITFPLLLTDQFPQISYGTGTVGAAIRGSGKGTISITDYPYLCTGSGDETTKIQQAIAALGPNQELLVPNGTFSFTKLDFEGKTDFGLRVLGNLVNLATKPGGTGIDVRASSPQKSIVFNNCARFHLYGTGSVQNGFNEALYFSNSTDFDVSLDCRGNGTNDNLSGVYVRYCQRFSFHRMTIDGVTLKPTNNATEVYNSWSNNVQIWDSSDFTFDGVVSRNSGMNGLYPASNCSDFRIVNCTLEYNAGSGAQMAWSSFGSFPVRWVFANNICRYNQADGLDVNNTAGSNAEIYAVINGNVHAYNGWINCNPANTAGVDGSGVGTFINVNRWSATNNQVYECANYGAYIQNCNNWSCAEGTITKSNAGTLSGGVYISAGTSGRFTGFDVKVPSTLPALTTQSMNDTVIRDNSFDGLLTFANGTYTGCKFAENKCTAYGQTLVQFDFMDNDVTATNAAQNGLYVVNPKLKVQRNVVSATGIGIVNTLANYTDISGNQATSTGASAQGIYVNGSTGVNVYGNDGVSIGASGIHLDATCNLCVLANNRGTSSTGNSIRVDTTCLLTQKFGNVAVSGTPSYLGTYGVNS